MNYLDYLEAEAIFIIREVLAEFENPVLMYSIGKDSSVLLHLLKKALYPTKINIPLTTAVLGGTIEVPGVDEKIKIKIKAGTPNEKVIKIRGKGVGEKKGHRGDLYVTIKINIPIKLSIKEKKIFKELQNFGI